jgi:cation:H+ antiporter
MTGHIIQFLISAVVIILAGTALSHFGDAISHRTRLGGALVGGLLLAGATSLPELAVDINAIRLGAPDLAVGDLFGSSLFNLLILAVFDLTRYSHGRMLSQQSAAHALTAGVGILMTALAAIFLLLGAHLGDWVIWRVGPGTLVLAVAYFVGFRLVANSRISTQPEKQATPGIPWLGNVSLRGTVIGFVAAAVLILVAGPFVAKAADALAEETGLGGTFFGSTFVALCTSLPELAATFAAVRLHAFDMALGNLLGSNAMNMALLFVLDFVDEGSLLANASPVHAYTALCTIAVTAVVILGQLHRVERRKPFLEPDALLALFLILGSLTGLYFLKP